MEFFEKKEEILDIQLTQFGKQKLLKGKFSPKYYAFYDDDIIYDTEYAGYTEDQNKNQDRILENIRTKLQANLAGIDTTSPQLMEQQSEADRNNFLVSSLGSAEPGNDKYPSWSIRFFNENLVRVVSRTTGSYFSYDIVPQLDATVTYRTFVSEDPNKDPEFRFQDDTFIDLEEDSLFIRVVENNTTFGKDNFEIEVFEREVLGGNEILKPLEFSTDSINNPEVFSDSEMVEYFLEVLVDNEVDIEEFCLKVPKDERSLYYVDRVFECQDLEAEKERQDIYDENDSNKIC